MDMSPAALPPIQPSWPKGQDTHPLMQSYRQHRAFCAQKMIQATSWDDFLAQHETQLKNEVAAAHPQYEEFLAWCREVKSGRRPCCPNKDNPKGLCFPNNFYYWLDGGRW